MVGIPRFFFALTDFGHSKVPDPLQITFRIAKRKFKSLASREVFQKICQHFYLVHSYANSCVVPCRVRVDMRCVVGMLYADVYCYTQFLTTRGMSGCITIPAESLTTGKTFLLSVSTQTSPIILMKCFVGITVT